MTGSISRARQLSSSYMEETPSPLVSDRCETCGKSFAHSSSYRRHTKIGCSSQSRKRRRRQLWVSEQHEECAEEDIFGVSPLLDNSSPEARGKKESSALLNSVTLLTDHGIAPNKTSYCWLQQTMKCHSSHCFSIVLRFGWSPILKPAT